MNSVIIVQQQQTENIKFNLSQLPAALLNRLIFADAALKIKIDKRVDDDELAEFVLYFDWRDYYFNLYHKIIEFVLKTVNKRNSVNQSIQLVDDINLNIDFSMFETIAGMMQDF